MSKVEEHLKKYAPEAWSQMQEHMGKPVIDQLVKAVMGYAIVTTANHITWPTDDDIVKIAIVFNDGKLEKEKLRDMVSCSMFILDRLRENGNVLTPSSKEI